MPAPTRNKWNIAVAQWLMSLPAVTTTIIPCFYLALDVVTHRYYLLQLVIE